MAPEILKAESLELPGLGHGFCGRRGGSSSGRYESFNLSRWVNDDSAAVELNWNALASRLPPHRKVVLLNQVHGTIVHRVGRGHDGTRLTGDGAVTIDEGVVLGIFTADCVPVLMIDPIVRVAGAVHAGWRGTLDGMARSAIDGMIAAGAAPEQIKVAMGPSIGPCCYEVDEELGWRFLRAYPDSAPFVRTGAPGKTMLDLRGVLGDQFLQAGVRAESISAVGPCTKCAFDRFFSRRGAGGVQCGLQLSFIGFTDSSSDDLRRGPQ